MLYEHYIDRAQAVVTLQYRINREGCRWISTVDNFPTKWAI